MTRLVPIPSQLRHPDLERRLPRNSNFRDRTGEKLNGSVVLGYAGILPPSFSAWLCRCDCGQKFIASSKSFQKPYVGCGCGSRKHDLSRTHIYGVWKEMMARCYSPKNPGYAGYGAKGVTVCRRWRESVKGFAEDMGERPSLNHVFERINLSGNFTPRNCRWILRTKSKVHGHRRMLIKYQGKTLSVPEWAKRLGISRQALEYRLRKCREAGLNAASAVSFTAAPAGAKRRTTRSN